MARNSTINVRILGDNKGLSDALDDSDSKLGSWASGAGAVVAAGLAAAGALGAVALTKGFTDALDAQANDALIAARLGVSPERAAELGDVAAGAYRDAWGDSLGDVTNVVTGLETSFDGLGNADLERLTGQAIALGDAFEVDTAQGIQTASELVSSGLAGSADEAFDLLTRGLQRMPQGIRDELFAASQEYGDFFGDLGLSGDVAFAKLTEYAEGGVYGIDKFGDALKELTIRGTDMSEASVDAYAAAGLSAEDMAERFLAGGDTARGALEDTAAGLLSIEDPVERANAAIALFGTPLEDLSTAEIPGFLEGLTDMSSGMGDVDGAAADMADALGGSTSAKLETFKRQALGALADFAARELIPRFEQVVAWFEANWPQIQETGRQVLDGIRTTWESVGRPVFDGIVATVTAVVEWFRTNWPTIRATIDAVVTWLRDEAWPVIQQIAQFIQTEFDALVAWVRENWPQIRETIARVIEAVRIIIETAVAIITRLWEQFGEQIIAIVANAWETVKAVVEAAVNIVRGIIDTVTALIRGDWDGVWEGIKTILSGVWDAMVAIVSGSLENVKQIIEAAWGTVDQYFSDTWNGLKTFVSDTWDAITGFVEGGVDDIVGFVRDLPGEVGRAASGAFDSIWESFRGVINRIIGGWNDLEFSIPGVNVPGPLPDIPGFTIGTPNIPLLATGAVVSSPMLAMVGEYSGARSNPEIVAPRSTMMEAMRDVLGEFRQTEFPRSLILEVDGRQMQAHVRGVMGDVEREMAGML